MLSTIFTDRCLRDTFLSQLAEWMVTQRWYSAKGADTPVLSVSGWVRLGDTPRRTTTLTTFVAADGRRFAVPITWTYLTEVALKDSGALISTLETPSGTVYIADATAVAEARAMLFAGLCREEISGEGITVHTRLDNPAQVECSERFTLLADTERLAGEQSNTSLIATCPDGSQVIMKIYRQLHEGDNPDIEMQRALQARGNTRIAPFIGSVHVSDAVGPSDLALIQTFLPDTQDAWREALVAASSSRSFAEPAATLGSALAGVHADLASAMPTQVASVNLVHLTLDAMKQRLDMHVAEVPELEPFVEPIRQAYARAAALSWPLFQRIHGDLHLGQVLNAPGRGWVLVDFEGEPLRPMNERSRPDSPARDVAGILRSIDYAAAYVELNEGLDVQQWAHEAREAFLQAYLGEFRAIKDATSPIVEVPDEDLRALISVFELDKAAYEVVYETRNRPEWAEIPLRALARVAS